jgi:hypothetical protein
MSAPVQRKKKTDLTVDKTPPALEVHGYEFGGP